MVRSVHVADIRGVWSYFAFSFISSLSPDLDTLTKKFILSWHLTKRRTLREKCWSLLHVCLLDLQTSSSNDMLFIKANFIAWCKRFGVVWVELCAFIHIIEVVSFINFI